MIGNAHELYSYCKEQLSVNQVASEREFIFRESSDVERERPNAGAALLVGTRKIQCSKCSDLNLSLKLFSLVCF